MKDFEKVSKLLFIELFILFCLNSSVFDEPKAIGWWKFIEIGIANNNEVLYHAILCILELIVLLSFIFVKKQKFVGGIISILICIFELIFGGIMLKIIVTIILICSVLYLVKFPKEESKKLKATNE